jgi:hypothetical protein
MRWTLCLFLTACATPAAQTAPAQQTTDIPPHTQALMDAYKNVEAQRAMRQAAPVPSCPGEDTPLQLREKYLRAMGGCVDGLGPWDPGLDLGSRAQWPALHAALDAQQGVDRCIRHARTFFDLPDGVSLRVEVSAEGAITSVRGEGEQSADVACCVRGALQHVRLPAPGRPLALALTSAYDAPTQKPGHVGGLRKDGIKAVITEHEHELPSCFEPALREGLSHGGSLTVRFVIAPGGEVARARIQSDEVGSPSAACCLVQKVRGWTFPKPEGDGPVVVTYPFVLQLGR